MHYKDKLHKLHTQHIEHITLYIKYKQGFVAMLITSILSCFSTYVYPQLSLTEDHTFHTLL